MSTSNPSLPLPQELPPAASGECNAVAMAMLRDVEVEITLEIGRRRMRIADVLKLTPAAAFLPRRLPSAAP